MYAILRVAKLKNMANISGSNNHIMRIKDAPNADPSLAKKNIYMGSKDPVSKAREIWAKHDIKPRKNAVMANEYVLTASPEFFKDKSTKEIRDWAKANLEFLKGKHGEGLISFSLHLDEPGGSPHIHAIVTPIYQNAAGKMKLSASEFFDKPKLKTLQTDYANAMKPFGLERGVENSRAKHTTVQKYYGDLENELKKSVNKANNTLKKLDDLSKEPTLFERMKGSIFQDFKETFEVLKGQYKNLAKLNSAMEKKHRDNMERLEKSVTELRNRSQILDNLLRAQGLQNDPEGLSVLADRNRQDAEKRAEIEREKFRRGVEQLMAPDERLKMLEEARNKTISNTPSKPRQARDYEGLEL
jgi:hypothetical protein